MDAFELGEELLRLQDEGLTEYFVPGGPADVPDWSRDEIKSELDSAAERIADNASAVSDRATYGLLCTLVRSIATLDAPTSLEIISALVGGAFFVYFLWFTHGSSHVQC